MVSLLIAFVLIAVLAGFSALEIFLAKQPARWPGLILPVVWFAVPLIVWVARMARGAGADAGVVVSGVLALFLWCIPAAWYLVLYFICCRVAGKKKALEKMHIQDLK